MNKLYERIDFRNGTTPALSQDNLNAMSRAIDEIDSRLIKVAPEMLVLQIEETKQLLKNTESIVENIQKNISMAGEQVLEASSQAILAKSYAVGETGTRIDEYKDNAKYYKGEAEFYKNEAKKYMNDARQYRNEAFVTTPPGYDGLIRTVNDNTTNIEKVSFKVDTVIEKADLRIKETASGESIHLTDSADAKVVEFGLYGKATQKTTTGKNLLDCSGLVEQTVRGVTFTPVYDNGMLQYINANGINDGTDNSNYYISSTGGTRKSFVDFGLNIGDSYVMNGCVGGSNSTFYLFFNGALNNHLVSTNGDSIHKTISTSDENVCPCIRVRAGVEVNNKKFYPMLRLASIEDDTYEPYTNGASPHPDYPQDIEVAGSSGNVVVKSCGKNLLNKEDYGNFTIYNNMLISNANGRSFTIELEVGSTYTLSKTSHSSGYMGFIDVEPKLNLYIDNRVEIKNITSVTFEAKRKYAVIMLNNDDNFDTIQVESGSEATPYEPYKETLPTIPTPNGLAGIKVSSGGNYTDSNGKQWICDEIVKYADGSGEYIRKIEKASPNLFVNNVVDASKWTGVKDKHTNYRYYQSGVKQYGAIISNITEAKNPTELWVDDILGCSLIADNGIDFSMSYDVLGITKDATADERVVAIKNYLSNHTVYFYYELAEPIRTPLTAEQIAEIEKLCTFYPVTNIYNDADCGMKATYIVDAKKYIDNKIAELATAMINSI